MNSSLQRRVSSLSRDRRFLIRASLTMVAVGAAVGLVSSILFGRVTDPRTPPEEMSAQELAEHVLSFENIVSLVRTGNPLPDWSSWADYRLLRSREFSEKADQAFDSILESVDFPSEVERTLLRAWWDGLHATNREKAISRIEAIPSETRYRNEFLGDLYVADDDEKRALDAYLAEAALFDESLYSHRSAIYLARSLEDTRLALLMEDPSFRSSLLPVEWMDFHTDRRDFMALALATLEHDWDQLRSVFLVPALFTGTIWFLILMTFWEVTRTRLIAAFAAVGLGILSASLTLFFVMIQDRIQGFTDNVEDTPLAQLIYWVAGVGLREETCKLICFIPVAVWAARRRNDLEGIVLASLVGLGFAFQENIGYFMDGDEYAPFGRMLSANPLHISLTGIAGFYLYRMIVRKFHGMEEFLIAFIAVVVAHGIYDAVISMPAVADLAFLSTILLAIIAYQFLDPLRERMDVGGIHRRPSPLGVFVLGSVLLCSLILAASAAFGSFRHALGDFALSVGSMIPLAFAFISRFRDL